MNYIYIHTHTHTYTYIKFIELGACEEKREGSQRKQGLLYPSAGSTPVKRGKEIGLDK